MNAPLLRLPVAYRRERWPEFIAEVLPLFERHYEEIAWRQDKIKLNPDCERYAALCKNGTLRIYTARNPALIGYATYFVSRNLHYKDVLCGINDLVYVEKPFRGRVGKQFLKYAETELKGEGVQVISYHIKKCLNWGPVVERMGFDHTEFNYQKWTGD